MNTQGNMSLKGKIKINYKGVSHNYKQLFSVTLELLNITHLYK